VQTYYGLPIFNGDFNGDGKVDWLFPGPSVALGNGDGTFGALHSYNSFGGQSSACAIGDLDGDTHVDVVCSYADTNNGDISGHWSLRFFHGNPDGSLTYLPSNTINFGDGSNQYEDYGSWAAPRYIVDLNGDGIPDILGVSVDGLTAYYGKGTYQFGPPVHFAAGNLTVGSSIIWNWQLTDLNGDHLPDIVSGSFNGLLLTLGKSGSSFSTASAYETNGVIGYVAVADFNGDGFPDIISTGDYHMAISLGRGDGTFLPYKNLDTGSVHWEGLYSHPDDNLLIHGDFNGDGKEDLIAVGSDVSGSFSENNYFLQGNGDGTFQPPISIGAAPGLSYLYGLSVVADLNGDGRADVIGKPDPTTGQIYATLSSGNGIFTSHVSTVPLEPTSSGSTYNYAEPFPGVADFDGDGKPDIIVAAHNNAYFIHGNGDGTFSNPVPIPIPPRPNAATSDDSISVVAGDFDGDGHQDFAVLWGAVTYGVYIDGPSAFGEILVYYGAGNGTFSSPVVAAYTTDDYVHLVAADLNQDGRDEIVAHGSGSLDGGTGVGVLRGAANRVFSPIARLVAGSGLANLQIADLNHDGFPDLVFSNEDYNVAANSATVLLNLGNTPTVTGSVAGAPEPSYLGGTFTITAALVTPDGSLLDGSVTFSIDGNVLGTATVTNNTASLIVAGTYSVGAHTLLASWAGNSNFGPVTLTGIHNVTAFPTVITLSSSVNPSIINQSVIFSAQVTAQDAATGTPSGSVVFSDGSNGLGTMPLDSSGNAALATSSLSVGTHAISAKFLPTNSFNSATGSLTQRVNALATATVLTVSPSVSTFGTLLTLTASVTTPATNLAGITGTVTFCSAVIAAGQTACTGTVLGSATLDAAGTAVLQLHFFDSGTYTFGCVYSGDLIHAPSTCNGFPVSITPASTSLTITSSANPSSALTPITYTATLKSSGAPIPSQSLAFAVDGKPLLSPITNISGSAVAIAPLTAGSHTISATFPGTTNFTSSSAQLTQTVTPNPTTITLVASPNPVYQNQQLTLVSTIRAGAGTATPDGSVTFYDGSTALGTVLLPALAYTGTITTATLTTSTLTSGEHEFTAVYTPANVPSNSFIASSSNTLSVTVLPQTYTITLADPILIIQAEHNKATTVTLTSVGGFTGLVSVDCGTLPAFVTCTWDQMKLTLPSNGTVSTKLTIDTDAVLYFKSASHPRPRSWPISGEVSLSLFVPLIFLRCKRRIVTFLPVALLVTVGLSLYGCSGKYPDHASPGTYRIAISASGTTAGAAGPVAQTATLTLVVTP
jgi:FG-GAP-like repeat/Bacterial Ig-like domain (group 3)